jgi:hypothetical protein
MRLNVVNNQFREYKQKALVGNSTVQPTVNPATEFAGVQATKHSPLECFAAQVGAFGEELKTGQKVRRNGATSVVMSIVKPSDRANAFTGCDHRDSSQVYEEAHRREAYALGLNYVP